MRRSKEIIVLLALLVGAMAFVLWYVIDRRARNRAAAPAAAAATHPAGPTPAGPGPVPMPPAAPVDLGAHDRQTVDFSSGRPVVKNTAEDQAAVDAALKDIAEASKGVTFEPAPKAPPAPAPRP